MQLYHRGQSDCAVYIYWPAHTVLLLYTVHTELSVGDYWYYSAVSPNLRDIYIPSILYILVFKVYYMFYGR
jgi:hypothetical protein